MDRYFFCITLWTKSPQALLTFVLNSCIMMLETNERVSPMYSKEHKPTTFDDYICRNIKMKRIISTVLTITLLFVVATMPLGAVEPRVLFHNRPMTTVRCPGTAVVVHSNHIAAFQSGQHVMEDGTICYITTVRLEHRRTCSTCWLDERFIADCQSSHSACGASVRCPY